jgi:FkbM family methyltransferase
MSGRPDDPLYALAMALNEDRYRIYDCHGYRIWLNVSESRQMVKRAIGRYEPEKFAAIAEVLKPGSCFLDIGGNKGDFALYAAALVEPAGRVVCFEPHPENAGWIRKSVELNGFESLTVEELALSDRDGEAELNIGGKSGQHSFEARKRDRGSVTVRTTTLDRYLSEAGIARVDAVKIDVEGAEDLVVAGARDMLARDRPVLFLDVHEIGDKRLVALTNRLGELGYRIDELESGTACNRLEAGKDYLLRVG